MILKPHKYQYGAARFMLHNPKSALFADPGTGKTAISLMVIWKLLQLGKLLKPVLITAPLRITTQVWPEEIAKWDQFKNITYRVLHGPDKWELAKEPADIHLVNNEGLVKLLNQKISKQYRTLVIDESSKFKNWSADRTKALRYRLRQFKRRHILTGSPAPKSLLDIFPQMFLTDAGKTLGRYISHFRMKYFENKGWGYPDWQIRPSADEEIYKSIAPSCYRLDGQQLLDLPEMIVNDIPIILPKAILAQSLDLLKALDLNLPLSGSSEYMTARRLAGGCLENKLAHDVKIKALRDLLDELQGKPALIAFYYRWEGAYLTKLLKAPKIDGTTTAKESAALIEAWNDRKLPALLVQPAAAGHGLNLQHGGNDVVWFSFTYNQDDYYQLNRRIWRQGVKGQVRIHRLIARNSVDVAMVRSLEAKTGQQKALLDAIKEIRENEPN